MPEDAPVTTEKEMSCVLAIVPLYAVQPANLPELR